MVLILRWNSAWCATQPRCWVSRSRCAAWRRVRRGRRRPTQEAAQEFRVLNSTYLAEYGRSGVPTRQSTLRVAFSVKGDGLNVHHLHRFTVERFRVSVFSAYTCRPAVRWPRGRRRRFAKPLYGLKPVSRVRIPASPPPILEFGHRVIWLFGHLDLFIEVEDDRSFNDRIQMTK